MIKKISAIILILLVSISVLAITVKGDKGNPLKYQRTIDTAVGTPFESTNSTSRYVLTKSLVENNSPLLSEDDARLAAPDVVYYNEKFVSIFMPGVSYVAVPFYILGKMYGIPQLTTFLVTALFALLNVFLITRIAVRLGASLYAGLIGGFVFLVATNALPYAQTLTQHHMSTAVLLCGLLLAFQKRNFVNNLLVGILFGAGMLLDIPNAFMMLPILLYVGFTNFSLKSLEDKVKISFKLAALWLVIGLVASMSLFGLYNYQTMGSYTLYPQAVGKTYYFEPKEKQVEIQKKMQEKKSDFESDVALDTRSQLNSSHILMLSNERGWLYYSPILFLGFLGFYIVYRREEKRTFGALTFSIFGMNFLVYSMFGDPWGGWSFGARYLIPGAAIMSTFIAIAVERYKKNLIFLSLFILLFLYSNYVTALGSLSTNAIPPKGEAEALRTGLPYTYEYNQRLLDINRSSSLMYNYFYKDKFPAINMVYVIMSISTVTVAILYVVTLINGRGKKFV